MTLYLMTLDVKYYNTFIKVIIQQSLLTVKQALVNPTPSKGMNKKDYFKCVYKTFLLENKRFKVKQMVWP